jgi:ORF 12 gene product N-terminal
MYRRISVATLGVAISMVVGGCAGPSAHRTQPREATTSTTFVSTAAPDTAVGTQLTWFLGAVASAPLPEQVIDAHFDALFLGQISPAKLNAVLAQSLCVNLDLDSSS